MTAQRVHKALARAGACSRRQAEALIAAGRVTVNGRVVSQAGARLDPDHDALAMDGRPLRPAPPEHWLAHKPRGIAWPPAPPRDTDWPWSRVGRRHLFALGRMSAGASGLLLLTNDGELVEALGAPGARLDADWQALVVGRPASADLRRLRRGLADGGARAVVALVRPAAEAQGWWVALDGLSSADRRRLPAMFDAMGHPVLAWHRTRLGPLALRGLRQGHCRRLCPSEVAALVRRSRGPSWT